ncbi:hypothetical protein [Fulvivirga ligni]|uniref:hypothetical protein n=1 Tax=Fulvivirga ligni TaxID=2904246 RepID=UPI001F1F6F2B|nr:hypothetical protein [Fulvivirga ligni]UII19910.1 hypothetical protein LVD16_18875 [Fulvivirga ligni]
MIPKEIFEDLSLNDRSALLSREGIFLKECQHFEKLLRLNRLGAYLVEACYNSSLELIQLEIIPLESAVLFYGIKKNILDDVLLEYEIANNKAAC